MCIRYTAFSFVFPNTAHSSRTPPTCHLISSVLCMSLLPAAGQALLDVGRTPAKDFIQSNAFVSVRRGTNTYFAMRKSLYYYREGILHRTENPLSDLTEDSVLTLVELSSCSSEQGALRLLQRLGSVDVKQPMSLLKAFSKFALVSVGDEARARWRQSDASVPWLFQHVTGKFSPFSQVFSCGGDKLDVSFQIFYCRGSGYMKIGPMSWPPCCLLVVILRKSHDTTGSASS